MTTQHTPGPWRVTRGTPGKTEVVTDDCTKLVADVRLGNPTRDANARLIAAAPELLAALQAFVNGAVIGAETSYKDRERITAARAAIAKAVQS